MSMLDVVGKYGRAYLEGLVLQLASAHWELASGESDVVRSCLEALYARDNV